jgi:hypothetical protein
MIQDLLDWLMITTVGFVPSQGMWTDSASTLDKRIIALMADGGQKPGVIERRQRVRVLLLSAKNGVAIAGEKTALSNLANELVDRSMIDFKYGNISQIKVIGEVKGPGQTDENRIFYEINFELLV